METASGPHEPSRPTHTGPGSLRDPALPRQRNRCGRRTDEYGDRGLLAHRGVFANKAPHSCALWGPPTFTILAGSGVPLGPAISGSLYKRAIAVLLTGGQRLAATQAAIPDGEAAVVLQWTSGSPTGAEGACDQATTTVRKDCL